MLLPVKQWVALMNEVWAQKWAHFLEESSIQIMNRVIIQFQLLRVFGGHYWVGEQTLNLP